MTLVGKKWPRFENLVEFTEEELWKELLEKMAIDKVDRRIKIRNASHLTFFIKKKRKDVELPENDQEALAILINMFLLLDFLPDSCLKEIKENFEEKWQPQIQEFENWSKVKKKQDRENLITKYITKQKKKHECTPKQTKQLIDLIDYGLIFKKINKKNIVLENNLIVEIENLQYNSQDGLWSLQ